MPPGCRKAQGLCIHVGPGREQGSNDSGMPLRCRQHQSCPANATSHIHVGTGIHQGSCSPNVAAGCRSHQGCLKVGFWIPVNLGPGNEQGLNGFGVTLPCRDYQR